MPNTPPPPATTTTEPEIVPATPSPATPLPDATPPTPPASAEEKAPKDEPRPKSADRLAAIDLSLLRTNDLQILYFDPAQTYLIPHVGRSAENALAFHKKMFDWKPWDRVTILLKDFSDYGNAAARSSPNNAVLLDVAPLSQTYETFSPGERFFTLTNHELTHVATMDVSDTHDLGWRAFLHGKPMPVQEHPETILYNYLATPRVNVPRWYLEGSAVFMETWMAGGLGRAQGGYDEMVFRAHARDHAPLYSPLGLESKGITNDFQVGVNDYLYGTRFYSYLALIYGPDKVIDWLKRDPGSAGYYATQFRKVFGKSLDTAWHEWTIYEQGFQQKNLDTLAKYPLTPVTHLTKRGLGSVSRTFYDPKTNSLIGAFRYPGVLAFVGTLSLDTGKIRKLTGIKGAMLYSVTSLAYDPDSRTAYYTEDNYAFRDVLSVNVDTGQRKVLLRDARIGELVVDLKDKSIWGLRHQDGFATLVRIPPPYAGFNQIHTFDYGQTPFDLDISPDGTMISASLGEINGDQSVRVWKTADLLAGDTPTDVAKLELPPSTPESFVFAPDGQTLYGSAYYTGVSNIFKFDIPSQKWQVVSNASTGFFRPIPQPDGSLIVYEFTGQGFTPSRIQPASTDDLGTIQFLGAQVAATHPEVKSWGVGSPAKVPLDALTTGTGKYIPEKERKLDAMYPFLTGYKQHVAVGYHFTFEDPLQFKQLNLNLSVSPFNDMPTAQRFHADVEYQTLDWKFRYWHNLADFYDLFGPVERSRKGDAISIGWKKTKIYDPPRTLDLFADAAAYTGLEDLPGAQNIPGPSKLLSFQAGARYSNATQSLGAVDHEKGRGWELVLSGDYGNSSFFPKIEAGFNIGTPLPWHNSSLWLYGYGGLAGGKRDDPLSEFYFGSYRNNYVDDRAVKRYRELESFPGFQIDEIEARSFVKAIGEWNLPPLRFAGIGTPSFYVSSARPALFVGVLATQQADRQKITYETVGGQLDFNFTVALRLPMTFSVGAASGFVEGHYRKTEVLASLKIL
ncbi:hypothetical protein HZF05_07125 [Sphingomonas sp. CGMCC 1.13654]|uniref:Uncharacterized protein n=1 Tax=Sphingomonas chungangi TaxID=2683589 RepID=A0A838L5I1_9SPHN|nr:hypothetical protein [Sphingomonas chungangi]MBA2933872.1 hypothetical protein [Sphingomonas chungangi]MVW55202.1 hypothetical protein [Sphingomonas chungangi]